MGNVAITDLRPEVVSVNLGVVATRFLGLVLSSTPAPPDAALEKALVELSTSIDDHARGVAAQEPLVGELEKNAQLLAQPDRALLVALHRSFFDGIRLAGEAKQTNTKLREATGTLPAFPRRRYQELIERIEESLDRQLQTANRMIALLEYELDSREMEELTQKRFSGTPAADVAKLFGV